jgi:hypothetical protein
LHLHDLDYLNQIQQAKIDEVHLPLGQPVEPVQVGTEPKHFAFDQHLIAASLHTEQKDQEALAFDSLVQLVR